MNSGVIVDFPWYALRVKNRHEKVVASSLEAKGYACFLPLYRSRGRSPGSRGEAKVPLLPGYLFCRINTANRLPVLMVPGVFHIVHAGKIFFPVDEDEIRALQTIVASDLYAQPWPFLKTGQQVRLDDGPLRGLVGYLTRVNDQARVVVSVTLLQRSVAVEIERAWLHPVSTVLPVPAASPGNELCANI